MIEAMLTPAHYEVYLRCKGNPLLSVGSGFNGAMVFTIDMERLIKRCRNPERLRWIETFALGCDNNEAAERMHVCLRTTVNWKHRVWE